MKELKLLSKDPIDRHHHIAFLDHESGIGIATSVDHEHQIEWVPPVEAQFDEQGNEIASAQPGYFEVQPAPDGHSHSLEDYEISSPRRKEKESDIVSEVYNLYRVWKEAEGDSIKKGQEAEKFRCGEQWTAREKSYLDSLDRASITLNWVGKFVDDLRGHQMQQRTDIKYLPVEGGDAVASDLLTITAKQILDQCYYQREKSKVFEDEVVAGRAWINLYVRRDRDLRGEIIAERFPWDQVVCGPYEKEDLSDCEGFIKHRMYSLPRMEADWPDKVKDIQRNFRMWEDGSMKSHVTYTDDQYAHSDNKYPAGTHASVAGDMMVDVGKKEYRILECWRRVYMNVPVVSAPDYNFYFNAYGWSKKDLDSLKTLPGFYVVNMPSHKIRITKVAGGVLLSDENPADLPVDDFFMVPVHAYKKGDRFWGKVEAVKDPQREVNYRRSQAIDIGNKHIAYSLFIKPETFKDESEKRRFVNKGSSPGGVYELSEMGDVPQRVEGPAFPPMLAQLIDRGMSDISELMNISVEQGGANTSGSALLERQKIRLTGNEFLFDALAFAEQKVGRLLVHLIQKYYDAERISRIVNHYATKNKVTLGGQPYEAFTNEQILEVLETKDLTKCDVVVSEATYSPSARTATFTLLSDLAQNGTPVPPEILVEFAPIPEEQRQKILEGIQMQNDAQSQTQQTMADAEVEKTLVSKGLIPPSTRERFGLPPDPATQQSPTDTQVNGELPPLS